MEDPQPVRLSLPRRMLKNEATAPGTPASVAIAPWCVASSFGTLLGPTTIEHFVTA